MKYGITLSLIIVCFLSQGCSYKLFSSHLPQEIIDYINKNLSNYHTVTNQSLNDINCKVKTEASSYCCYADFNGDNIKDYALLLRNQQGEICLLFFGSKNQIIFHQEVDCFGHSIDKNPKIEIAIEPKGTWEGINEQKEVPYDGITVQDLEESLSKSYFWNGTAFERFFWD